MNKFKEYATSTAFSIKLSKRQVEVLLCLRSASRDAIYSYSFLRLTLVSLEDKGLIKRNCSAKGWKLTAEGRILCDLLQKCGFDSQGALEDIAA